MDSLGIARILGGELCSAWIGCRLAPRYNVIMIFDDSTSLMDTSMNTLYLALAYLVPHCASSPGSSTRALDSTIIILWRSLLIIAGTLF